MTQRQQYAVVPREPADEQIAAARDTDDFYTADVQMIYRAAIEAAPPPPEQVLEDSELMWHWSMTPQSGDMRVDLTEFARRVERAVLKQLGAKNV